MTQEGKSAKERFAGRVHQCTNYHCSKMYNAPHPYCPHCGTDNILHGRGIYMNFGEALDALKAGKKVKRNHWNGYWFMSDDLIAHTYGKNKEEEGQTALNPTIIEKLKDDGGYVPAQASHFDMLAEDWIVVK